MHAKRVLCLLLRLLTRRMEPSFRERGEEFRVILVNDLRDYKAALPKNFHLSGAFGTRRGIEAPHHFTFVQRRGLTWHFLTAKLGGSLCSCRLQPYCNVAFKLPGLTREQLAIAAETLPRGVQPSMRDTYVPLLKDHMHVARHRMHVIFSLRPRLCVMFVVCVCV